MRKAIFLLGILLALAACGKDDEEGIIGIVIEKKGCYPDSYLVKFINTGGTAEKEIACPDYTPVVSAHNCTNAVFMHLPSELGIPGKKIRFIFDREELSCLSFSYAPKHIIVKSVRAD